MDTFWKSFLTISNASSSKSFFCSVAIIRFNRHLFIPKNFFGCLGWRGFHTMNFHMASNVIKESNSLTHLLQVNFVGLEIRLGIFLIGFSINFYSLFTIKFYVLCSALNLSIFSFLISLISSIRVSFLSFSQLLFLFKSHLF